MDPDLGAAALRNEQPRRQFNIDDISISVDFLIDDIDDILVYDDLPNTHATVHKKKRERKLRKKEADRAPFDVGKPVEEQEATKQKLPWKEQKGIRPSKEEAEKGTAVGYQLGPESESQDRRQGQRGEQQQQLSAQSDGSEKQTPPYEEISLQGTQGESERQQQARSEAEQVRRVNVGEPGADRIGHIEQSSQVTGLVGNEFKGIDVKSPSRAAEALEKAGRMD
ncbi:hypothetical protein QYM36_007890 [Artemia franciscana]|uniref:Uncharacterized protein n=1 Tax=Artemia franciscana TaxID=6661 RepID=A0AA88IDD5_ARTSF|nr:hypothetical protein QYM36_007890 [Artemia franciscana]